MSKFLQQHIKKMIIIALLFLQVFFSYSSYGYWASQVAVANNQNITTIGVGEWTYVSTAGDFLKALFQENTFQENANIVLQNDIDFDDYNQTEYGRYPNHHGTTFKGTVNGNGYRILNLDISTVPGYMGDGSRYRRGLFATIDGATIENIIFENVKIDSTSGDVGILAGTASGTNHISNVTIKSTYFTGTNDITGLPHVYRSAVGTQSGVSGGLIGDVLGNAVLNLTNIKVDDVLLEHTVSGGHYSGGLIGRVRSGATVTINDAFVRSTVINKKGFDSASHAPNGVGAVIGINYGNITFNRLVVDATHVYAVSNGIHAGGIVGDNKGSITVNHGLVTGYFRSQVSNPGGEWTTLSGIFQGAGNAISNSNSTLWATDIYLYHSQTELSNYVHINSSILYTKITGGKPDYATRYVSDRSILTIFWWQDNFESIYDSDLWTYQSATHLFELNDS